MKKLSLFLTLAAILAMVGDAPGQAEYQYDDGVSENALGHGVNGDFLWGNYFNELPNASTITNVSVAFGDGGVLAGQAFDVAIYDDMDDNGDPSDGLMFLGSTAGTVDLPGAVGMDSIQIVDVPDVVVSGGFFVAAFIDGTNNPFPAMLDQTTSAGQSWFAEHDVIGGLDLMDPFGTATLSGQVDAFAFPGNWLLRANDSSGECLLGDITLDGAVTLADVTPFVNLLTSGKFQCEGDFTMDGAVTLADVGPFVDALTGG